MWKMTLNYRFLVLGISIFQKHFSKTSVWNWGEKGTALPGILLNCRNLSPAQKGPNNDRWIRRSSRQIFCAVSTQQWRGLLVSQNCFSKKADVEHKKIIDGFKSICLALATCAAICRTLVCATPLHHVCEICLRHWQDHARETFYSHVFA